MPRDGRKKRVYTGHAGKKEFIRGAVRGPVHRKVDGQGLASSPRMSASAKRSAMRKTTNLAQFKNAGMCCPGSS